MSRFLASIAVTLKPTVNDPEGLTIASALHNLGFAGVAGVRSGKLFEVTIEAASADEAQTLAEEMCTRLLANPVIERYSCGVAEDEPE
ncbi:MAG: phosphoribosylformylglycinamidine synthase subunit PurS [Chloroflexi bacterium]|nr:phosphoribosylformylglycinamidine synthase subunit PurS [Chloroflexota bacterium]